MATTQRTTKFFYPPRPGSGAATFSDNIVGLQTVEEEDSRRVTLSLQRQLLKGLQEHLMLERFLNLSVWKD